MGDEGGCGPGRTGRHRRIHPRVLGRGDESVPRPLEGGEVLVEAQRGRHRASMTDMPSLGTVADKADDAIDSAQGTKD